MSRAEPVTRTDIEAKLREIKGEVESTGERARTPVLVIGTVVIVVVVGLAYVLGSRRGRKRTTLVEVRRV